MLNRGDRLDDFRKRAAILHTDAAILGSPPVLVVPPDPRQHKPRWARENPSGASIVKSFDGRVEKFELRNLHWDFAMDVLDSLPGAPAAIPWSRQWYRAIGAYFASERRFADALEHFDRARAGGARRCRCRVYGEACLHETLGAPRIQNYVQVTTLPNSL